MTDTSRPYFSAPGVISVAHQEICQLTDAGGAGHQPTDALLIAAAMKIVERPHPQGRADRAGFVIARMELHVDVKRTICQTCKPADTIPHPNFISGSLIQAMDNAINAYDIYISETRNAKANIESPKFEWSVEFLAHLYYIANQVLQGIPFPLILSGRTVELIPVSKFSGEKLGSLNATVEQIGSLLQNGEFPSEGMTATITEALGDIINSGAETRDKYEIPYAHLFNNFACIGRPGTDGLTDTQYIWAGSPAEIETAASQAKAIAAANNVGGVDEALEKMAF